MNQMTSLEFDVAPASLVAADGAQCTATWPHAPHGIGMNPGHGPMSEWPARCADWMKGRGLLSPPK